MTQFPSRKQKILIALVIYITVVIFSISILILKRDALKFHQRDYNYFVEQAARLTDARLTKSFTLQIEGYNFLGLQGIEGVKSLYHAIHTEYFRYLYVLIYGIFKDPLALYILYTTFFFLPILYFAVLPHPNDRQHALIWLLFTLLYLVFPATLYSVTADLRPRVLFAAAWCLVVLSIYFDRPFWEKLLFFILLVCIREEGIILGAVAIMLNYIKMRGRPGRSLQTAIFIIIDIVALILFLAFMRWGGFTRVDNIFSPLNFIRLLSARYWIVILAAGALVVFLLWFTLKTKNQRHQNMFVFCYTLAVVISGFQWLRDLMRWYNTESHAASVNFYDIYIQATTNETTALVSYILILLGVILWEYSRGYSRKLLIAVYSILILLFSATTITYYSPILSEWRENVAPAKLVWNFASTHDHYDTEVLLDYDTYQAFYNFDKVIVYNRLPLWDTLPEKRYYPENKSALVKQIQKGMDYAVISRDSLENVLELAEMAKVPASVIDANERYVVLSFQEISSGQDNDY